MSMVSCPDCSVLVDDQSDVCPHCSSSLLVAAEPAESRVSRTAVLRQIAVRQKWLLYALLLNIICTGTVMLVGQDESRRQIGQLLLFLTVPFQILCFVRLAASFNMSIVKIVLCCMALFVPCVSLIVLMTVNDKATKALQAAGIRVGLMGARLSSIP